MKISKKIQQAFEKDKTRNENLFEAAKIGFAVDLEKRRRLAGLSYVDIAKNIGKSAAYISKVFRGDTNLTIESMVKLAKATNSKLHIELVEENVVKVNWARLGKFEGSSISSNQAYVAHSTNFDIDAVIEDGIAA